MGRDAEQHAALVSLAGWIWLNIRRGIPSFTRADIEGVTGLERFAQPGDAGRRALARGLEHLAEFGISTIWDEDGQSYRVKGTLLSDKEQRALAALAFHVAFEDLAIDAAWRVPGAFLEDSGETVLLGTQRWIGPIADAISERQCLTITYSDVERSLQPVSLGLRRGTWYLVAYEHGTERTKVYRLDRIDQLASSDTGWDRHLQDRDRAAALLASGDDPMMWGEASEPVIDIEIAVESGARQRASRILKTDTVDRELPDGRVVLTRPVRHMENFIDAALALRSRAEVLTPESARAAMMERLDGSMTP